MGKKQNKDIEKKWRGTHTCAVCGKSNLKRFKKNRKESLSVYRSSM